MATAGRAIKHEAPVGEWYDADKYPYYTNTGPGVILPPGGAPHVPLFPPEGGYPIDPSLPGWGPEPVEFEPEPVDTRSSAEVFAEIAAAFPWMQQLGLTPQWFQNVAAESSSTAEIVAKLRQSPEYKLRFPSINRADGSVRMNEAQYIAREGDFRTLLKQYGYDMSSYSTPSTLGGFFDKEIDPNEFKQRLDVYQELGNSSQNTIDAFYVYAGITVSVDDLYSASVDPIAREGLSGQYVNAISGGKFNYQTFITRATQVGNRRVADALSALQSSGAVTSEAVNKILSIDPLFGEQIVDALYTGGDPGGGGDLSLQELLSAFEYAGIGAAATNSNLVMPTRERVVEIRSAGIDRARAAEAYSSYGMNKNLWNAASMRSGGGGLTQTEFEDAAFFGDVDASAEIQRALASEKAAGVTPGGFRFVEDRGRVVQKIGQ